MIFWLSEDEMVGASPNKLLIDTLEANNENYSVFRAINERATFS